MDRTTETIVAFAAALTVDDLPPACLDAVRTRLLDSVACAIGGFDSPPSHIARKLASRISAEPGARVLGTGAMTAPELAAFTNTVMLRVLDYNDTYVSRGSLHPSDLIPAALAAAEVTRSSGAQLVLSIVLGYEVACAMSSAVNLRERGWDQGIYVSVGSAVAAGKLLGLTRAQLGHAVALALVPQIPLRQTRAGELSMWKGCATAASVRGGVFAAQLAQFGMTGPDEPFEGRDGLFARVTGEFDLCVPLQADGFAIQTSNLKLHPSEYHSQAPLDLVPTILERTPVDRIRSIDVETYWMAYSEIGSEPAKWTPETRETADHSLPFLLASALLDGRLSLDAFSDARLRAPKLRQLMQRIRIEHDPLLTERYPEELPSRLHITTTEGDSFTLETTYPRGHFRNPASVADIEAKFTAMADGALSPPRQTAIREAIASVDRCADAGELLSALIWRA
jgi:2-methylcitrate dehydratase